MEPMDIDNDSFMGTTEHQGEPSLSSSPVHSEFSETRTLDPSSPIFHDPSSADSFEEVPRANVYWSLQDEHFAQMFRGWDNLPVRPSASLEEKLTVLRALEDIIVPFEKAIGSSDEGFATWRLRHQAALECFLSHDSGWPKLHCDRRGWLNNAWAERYHYLVKIREKLVWHFSSSLPGRGRKVPRPARLSRQSSGKNRIDNTPIRSLWARSVDELLTAEAQRLGIPAQIEISNFWSQTSPSSLEEVPALFNGNSGSDLSSPPSVLRAADHGQPWPRCVTPTPSKGNRVVIKIESDSE